MTLDDAKRIVFEAALAVGRAMVRLDARRPGVDVPEWHKNNPALLLRFGNDLRPPVVIAVDELEIRALMSFAGRGYTVAIPWHAVSGVFEEVRGEIGIACPLAPIEVVGVELEPVKALEPVKKGAHLRLVPMPDEELELETDGEPRDPKGSEVEPWESDPPKGAA